jgi:hypothetical protein
MKHEVVGVCGINGGQWRLVNKFEGKGSLGRPIHRWKDDIEMLVREIGWHGDGLD